MLKFSNAIGKVCIQCIFGLPLSRLLLFVTPLQIDQAALTGESLPVKKNTGDVAFSGSTIKQASCCLYQYIMHKPSLNDAQRCLHIIRIVSLMLTVTQGERHCVVYATGMNTFFGRAAALLGQADQVANIQKIMTKISAICLITIFVWVVILLGVQFGHWRHECRGGEGEPDPAPWQIGIHAGIHSHLRELY